MFRKDGKVLFNDGWKFKLDEGGWNNVELPHDWLIYDTQNLYKTGEGRYKKTLNISIEDLSKSIELYFDGIYMNSTVYVNGVKAGEWKYGYTSFYVEISDYVHIGDNEILINVLHESPNSRWYSGAGIYRDVWLIKQNKTHITSDGVYIHADVSGKVIAHAHYTGKADEVRFSITDVDNPILWSPEKPHLYTMKTELIKDGEAVDCVYNKFGFRTIEFSPDKGFIFNAKPFKLHGVCHHHDLGALGAAVNVHAIRRQLELLKDMGVNSIRTAHNPPAPQLIELCDEMGLLVINELTDMWELPKNKYDYARFFPQWYKKDVKSWVRRDRNHPCVIMWSIGNEIYDTHVSHNGLKIAKNLYNEVKRHDPYGNGGVTIGSNFMMGENARKVADFLKLAGYNYAEKFYDEHHRENPGWFIYGSETTSTVRSRGIYHFPIEMPLLTHDDKQCSDLGNSVVGWGKSNEGAWLMDEQRQWCGGEFVWTGFDYIGEPTPYNSKNSYFGAIDTAGLPKASYYFYKSVWNKNAAPFVKLFPHWDWNEGQIIDVVVYSNMQRVELFLNGEIQASRKIKYTKGELVAKAYDLNGNVAAVDTAASFGEPSQLRVQSREYGDLTFCTICAYDKNGEFVANARNRVIVKGDLLGLDNGDSTDYDSYKPLNNGSPFSRRLFSGKLTAISRGGIEVEFDTREIPPRKIELTVSRQQLSKTHPTAEITATVLPENAHDKNIRFKCVSNNGIETNIAHIRANTIIAKGDGDFRIRAYIDSGNGFTQVFSELEMSVCGMGRITRAMDSFAVFTAASCDRIYGDSYEIDGDSINWIGNNVVLEFHGMDFGQTGASRLIIRGSTPLSEVNSIRINHGEQEQLIEFQSSYCLCEQTFEINRLSGVSDLRFTFLPGSNFCFSWFRFLN
jgi:beta-galactosidase